MKKYLFSIIFFLVAPVFSTEVSPQWRIKTYYEKFKNQYSAPNEKRSVLVLKNQIGGEKVYKPEKPPFGLGKKQILEINRHTLVMTLWPDGANMMMIRVFDPTISEQPLCEVVSFAEGLKVRMVENVVEVEKALQQNRKVKLRTQWEKCHTYK